MACLGLRADALLSVVHEKHILISDHNQLKLSLEVLLLGSARLLDLPSPLVLAVLQLLDWHSQDSHCVEHCEDFIAFLSLYD
jgi:hypothetical protein